MHRDQLASVRLITGADGAADKRTIYHPFGETRDWISDAAAAEETKGFIGERYDADAGLQYLNARYYDPELGLFIQPDWFDVNELGVGTNRYSYAFNGPVNASDPSGNFVQSVVGAAVGAAFSVTVDVAISYSTTGKLPSGRELAKSAAVGAIAGATGAGIGALATKAAKASKYTRSGYVDAAEGYASGAVGGAVGETLDQAVDVPTEGPISDTKLNTDLDADKIASAAL